MPEITVSLPDGSTKSVPEGTTVLGVAESIGSRLAAASIAGRVNGALVDVSTTVSDGDTVELITDKSPEALDILRHSAAHIMAEAVKDLFPLVQFGIGPAIEDGFYYDFAVETPFTPDDLVAIEERMHQIVAEEKTFARTEIDRLEFATLRGDPYCRSGSAETAEFGAARARTFFIGLGLCSRLSPMPTIRLKHSSTACR